MPEARWYPKLMLVLCRELHADPFAEVGRRTPQVNRDIKYLSRNDPDELPLGLLNLIVETAQRAFC